MLANHSNDPQAPEVSRTPQRSVEVSNPESSSVDKHQDDLKNSWDRGYSSDRDEVCCSSDDSENDEELLDVNLSQSYLDDGRVSALLERRQRSNDDREVFPRYSRVARLALAHNQLTRFPERIGDLRNLVELDLSNNNLTTLSECVGELTRLRVLSARNNHLSDLPKSARALHNLRTLNLSGNRLAALPAAVIEMRALVELQLGGNRITTLPPMIDRLECLEILYLGGNRLTEVPASLGRLTRLTSLVLADNRFETLPATFANLRALQSLTLHNNRLRALPNGLARLPHLEHLSLRNNPLVTSFAKAVRLAPPTLKELAARVLTVHHAADGSGVPPLAAYASLLPRDLLAYLASANHCVNPRCRGVYFESCAELVKFVDFCGKYRVPLMQYLCSPHCTQTTPTCAFTDSEESSSDEENVMRPNGDDQRSADHEFDLTSASHPSTSHFNLSSSDSNAINDAKMKRILIG